MLLKYERHIIITDLIWISNTEFKCLDVSNGDASDQIKDICASPAIKKKYKRSSKNEVEMGMYNDKNKNERAASGISLH